MYSCDVLGTTSSHESVLLINNVTSTTVIMTPVESTSGISDGKLNDLP